ncbi:MAG: hypothetical protein H0U54_12380 [Acidobacteria bacterium]|jgi:hypothetical protein|nr:hypothetical protein [Acidobacteriota bacterium]
MALLEGKTPSERKKTIAAIVLGAVALISLAYMILGSSSSKPSPVKATKASPTPGSRIIAQTPEQLRSAEFIPTVLISDISLPAVPEAGRNIFAFYVPPPPKAPSSAVPVMTPTPTPVPPNVVVASISPVNVYAHTGDFTFDVTGDKFTPETRIFIGGAELPTRFVSAQQLSAKVPAQLISFEGGREVKVQSRDGQLFSNTATLNVMPAPVPNYIFTGVLTRSGSNDTAMMKEKNGKDLLNVQRGDVLGGRFRVTSISVQEVTLTDTSLNIKHKLALVGDSSSPGLGGQPRYQPPPPSDNEETEP